LRSGNGSAALAIGPIVLDDDLNRDRCGADLDHIVPFLDLEAVSGDGSKALNRVCR
jgi:hypothetical protein